MHFPFLYFLYIVILSTIIGFYEFCLGVYNMWGKLRHLNGEVGFLGKNRCAPQLQLCYNNSSFQIKSPSYIAGLDSCWLDFTPNQHYACIN